MFYHLYCVHSIESRDILFEYLGPIDLHSTFENCEKTYGKAYADRKVRSQKWRLKQKPKKKEPYLYRAQTDWLTAVSPADTQTSQCQWWAPAFQRMGSLCYTWRWEWSSPRHPCASCQSPCNSPTGLPHGVAAMDRSEMLWTFRSSFMGGKRNFSVKCCQ